MKHCMIDLETWGTKPGSALRSIGAVMFELDGSIGSKFYRNIIDDGRRDQSTVEWWSRQGLEAQQLLEKDRVPLDEVIESFHQGFKAEGAKFLWSHGANFDSVLWESACQALGFPVPWMFFNVRCTRTWYHAHDFDAKSIKFEGVKHFALDDALHQVKCVQTCVMGPPQMMAPSDLKMPEGNTFGM